MKVQEHIGKITWSFADKLLYVLYGIVTLFQMKALDPNELGLFALLINLHTWIFIVGDSFLSNIIQFGMNKENRKSVNTFSLILITAFTLCLSLVILSLSKHISEFFNLPRFPEIASALPILSIIFIPRTFCIKLIFRDSEMHNLFFTNLAFFGTMSLITIILIIKFHFLNFSNMLSMYYIGAIVSSLVSIIITRRKLEFGWNKKLDIKRMLAFDLPLLLNGSLNALPKQLDIYIVQYFFSTTVVGVYYSAKNLFRFFEESAGAALGLVYPAAVRQLEKKNHKGLNDLMTKSVSFLFVGFLFIIIILELGLSKVLITAFLPIKYHLAIGQFNLLIIASLGLPFVVLSSIINAAEKPLKVFQYVFVSLIFSMLTFYLIGISGKPNLIPLGYMVYLTILGFLCFYYVNRNFQFKIVQVFRAFIDTKNYFISKFKK
ncbi:MAG: oligosaccharide flippase family protein [FCB group bacterium]